MKHSKVIGSLLLLITAVIWGSAFVAQSVGMDYIEPFTFSCARSLIGGLVLIPYIYLRNGKKGYSHKSSNENQMIGGICCGLCLFGGMTFQQIGIQYTTAGKAGFITACYIVIVPVISYIFLRKKSSVLLWVSVILGGTGLYLLCVTGTFSIGKGDIYVFMCAFMFSLHILVIDYFTKKADPVKLACIQFFVCGIISGVLMFMIETPDINLVLKAWQPILYAGVLSTGIGYTFQIIGQKNVSPTVASLIMSLEAVASVVAGCFILNEKLTDREFLGCVIMFAAIILAQFSDRKNAYK